MLSSLLHKYNYKILTKFLVTHYIIQTKLENNKDEYELISSEAITNRKEQNK